MRESGLPPATVQMIYHVTPEDGLNSWLTTASRGWFHRQPRGGLETESGRRCRWQTHLFGNVEFESGRDFARRAGGTRRKNREEFTGSCLMASGQFCTSRGWRFCLPATAAGQFIAEVKTKMESAPANSPFSGVPQNLAGSVKTFQAAGAELLTGGGAQAGNRFANTLLRVSGEKFLAAPEKLQTEAFGNATLIVVVHDAAKRKGAWRI